MARSFTLGRLSDDKGLTLSNVRCVAYRLDTHLEVEVQYTDANGDATFTTLPDTVACIIFAYHHDQADRYYSDVPTDVSGSSDTVVIDVNGITIKGTKLILQDSAGDHAGNIYIATDGALRLDAWLYTETKHLKPITNNSYDLGGSGIRWDKLYIRQIQVDDILCTEPGGDLGTTTFYFADVTSQIFTLKETTTPTAAGDHGKVYTKNDNKLYFQDGAGTEHTVAFV